MQLYPEFYPDTATWELDGFICKSLSELKNFFPLDEFPGYYPLGTTRPLMSQTAVKIVQLQERIQRINKPSRIMANLAPPPVVTPKKRPAPTAKALAAASEYFQAKREAKHRVLEKEMPAEVKELIKVARPRMIPNNKTWAGWSEEEDKILKELVMRGWSFSRVAAKLNRTRNACIGRFHRHYGDVWHARLSLPRRTRESEELFAESGNG